MPAQLIFAGNGVYSGDVVDGLVEVHAYECMGCDCEVSPANIPVTLFRLIYYFHPQAQCHLPHHWVVCDCVLSGLQAVLMTTWAISGS